MSFTSEGRLSDSPLVELIWRARSSEAGRFTSIAATHWEIVVTRQRDQTVLTVRGPETKAMPAPVPEDAEFMGVVFKLGTFMPHLPVKRLVDNEIHLPDASTQSFWLHGAAWPLPSYDNADVFVRRLVRQGMLVRDPIVEAVLQEQSLDLSARSVQRRFLHATGLTYAAIRQIERARQAMTLLRVGMPILDVVDQLGYFDQSHLTNTLKRYIGQTPAQLARLEQFT